MFFNSLNFAIFLPIVFLLYWFIPNKSKTSQNYILIIASYYFYSCWDWRFLFLLLFSTNVYAAQTQIAQVNGMMCIKCQKMVTKALQAASPNATVKVSWPEGVAVSTFIEKSNLTDEDYKNTILGTGFEVIKLNRFIMSISPASKPRPRTEMLFSKPSLIFNANSFSFKASLSPDLITRARL